ncbi:hypothetical protein C8Q80DRAFT_1125413 [Daedaleopsis nitida]|nr:hypothetical protein C8Q80DRAFT_1125611 [Daedaleopsis nitida]KAI0737431.1 hypothetical protein C8Q80DRAFT_1125413 [Daedaleopsis nitida]
MAGLPTREHVTGSVGSLRGNGGNLDSLRVQAASHRTRYTLPYTLRYDTVHSSILRIFLVLYLVTLPLQLISTGSFLEQGSTALTAITAVHAGFVAATFWALLGNAIVSTQVVEDGTISSLVPFDFFAAAFLAATTYVALDTGFHFTSVFASNRPRTCTTSRSSCSRTSGPALLTRPW